MTLIRSRFKNTGTYLIELKKMLRAVRTTCGFSQDDIAAVLHIHRATYTNYEIGKTCPDVPTLVALSAIFQIPPESFLHPEEFTDLRTTRQRVRHMPTVDPQKVGDLSEEEKQMIAAHRLKTNFPAKAPDKISSSIEGALKQFNIKKTYKGYPFLVSAIREAVIALPERLTTPEICERVSANEKADPAVVDRELKRMFSNIWGFTENPPVYSRIVKHEIVKKPLPVEFIYALADYLTRQKC